MKTEEDMYVIYVWKHIIIRFSARKREASGGAMTRKQTC